VVSVVGAPSVTEVPVQSVAVPDPETLLLTAYKRPSIISGTGASITVCGLLVSVDVTAAAFAAELDCTASNGRMAVVNVVNA
jgi:hypothetical protein